VSCRLPGQPAGLVVWEGGMVARDGGRSPFVVTLRAGERRFLKARACQATAPYRQVVRARIVLLAAAGLANAHIARKLGIAPNTAGKWAQAVLRGGSTGWPIASGLAARGGLRPRSSPRARRSRVSCPSPAGPAWPLEPCRAASRGPGHRPGRRRLHHDAVALAGRGPDQAMAAPLVDLPPRPCLRRQGRVVLDLYQRGSREPSLAPTSMSSARTRRPPNRGPLRLALHPC
jgi:hypothetical protein